MVVAWTVQDAVTGQTWVPNMRGSGELCLHALLLYVHVYY